MVVKLHCRIVAALLLLLVVCCQSANAQRENFRPALASAWSFDETKVVIVESDGMMRLLVAGRKVPLWSKHIDRLPTLAEMNAGMLDDRPKLVIKWVNRSNILFLAYLLDESQIKIAFLNSNNGAILSQQVLNSSRLPSKSNSYLDCAVSQSGEHLGLLCKKSAGEPGLLWVLNSKKRKISFYLSNINIFQWLSNTLLLDRMSEKKQVLEIKFIGNKKSRQIYVTNFKDLNGWVAAGPKLVYVLKRANQSSERVTLICYKILSGNIYKQWSRSWTTGFREPGSPNDIIPSGFGEVAVGLPYGTDGVSNGRIWCASSSKLYTPRQILSTESTATGMYALVWRGKSLLFSVYYPSEENPRYYLYSSHKMKTERVFQKEVNAEIASISHSYLKALYKRKTLLGSEFYISGYIN